MTSSNNRSRETRCCKRRFVLAALVACASASVTLPSRAQSHPPQLFLTVNGGVQPAGRGFVGSAFLDHALFGSERGHLYASYGRNAGPLWDGGGGVGIWRRLAVGTSVSRFLTERGARLNALLPHPFRFDRPREIRGAETRTMHRETALHIQAQWVIPATDSLVVTLFGGPSWFHVAQELVVDVHFEQAYPYDKAAFAGAVLDKRTATTLGAHAGVDAAYYFLKWMGVGGGTRFSYGTVELDVPSGATINSRAGGFQVLGGLRIRY